MASYFIKIDTYWQNSKSYFVGPFSTKADAEAWHQQDVPNNANVWYSTSLCGGNIADAWCIYPGPLSKTAARKRGLNDNNLLDPQVKPIAKALDVAVRELREESHE
jgi:hypothetical protein